MPSHVTCKRTLCCAVLWRVYFETSLALTPGVLNHVFMMTLVKISIYIVLRVCKTPSHIFPH